MHGKGALKLNNKGKMQGRETHDNSSKPQENKNTTKIERNIVKWCESHKSPTHNTSECQAMQSLLADVNFFEWYACSNCELEAHKGNDKGKNIIYVEPNATLVTTKIDNIEPEYLEEREWLFHS